MLLHAIPLADLRERVREAESLLRIARQHARDAKEDATRTEYTSRRIAAVLQEVDALFPGLGEPQPEDPNVARMMAQLLASADTAVETDDDDDGESAAAAAANEQDVACGSARDDGDEVDLDADPDPDPEEWEIDYAQLGRAIENEALMAKLGEPEREAFKGLAQHLIETNERAALLERVSVAIGSVSKMTEAHADELRRQVALALTFEELANKASAQKA